MKSYGAPDKAHVPVFAQRVGNLLAPVLDGREAVCVDATLGAGGHTLALLQAHPRLRVIGIDRDPDALALAQSRLEHFGDRFRAVRGVYDTLDEVMSHCGVTSVAAVLFDLGVSSMQLDVAERGFAYAKDAPLDMRMDQSQGATAADIVNTYDERDLSRILRVYGEERFASRIARSIVAQRKRSRLESSRELADLVREAVPAATRRKGGNPSKRTFQALRIEVNGELDVLRRALPLAVDAVEPDGRIVVLSYHSLEDRIVKRELGSRTVSSAPPGLPLDVPGTEPSLRWVAKGAQPPTESEIAANPRAASAKLRAAQRLPVPTTNHDRHSQGED